MIIVYLTPDGEQLQQPSHEIGRAATVQRASDILDAAYTMYDSLQDGTLQAVSDRTGYVYAERILYRYMPPTEANDLYTRPLDGVQYRHLAGMDGVDVPIEVLAMLDKRTARIRFLADDRPRGWKRGDVTECNTFQLL